MTQNKAATALAKDMWKPLQDMARLPIPKGKDLEERLRFLEEELAVRDVASRYSYFYDGGDLDGVMTVFSEDCVLVNPRGTYIGVDAIRENYGYLMNNRKLSFHFASNMMVRLSEDATEASMAAFYHSVSFFTKRQRLGSSGGTYLDRLKKTPNGWLIVERRITHNYRSRLIPDFPPENGAKPPAPSRNESSTDWIGDDAAM